MTIKKTPAITTATDQAYYLVCGLEIHAELKTKSKMFCGCPNAPFDAPGGPNTHTCPVCLGMPGGLPVANQKAIESVIKLGLFLGCQINQFSKFDRKNYFYPDLSKSYQLSQYDLPFVYGGAIETSSGPIRLTRIHLEEDTAKLLHDKLPDGREVSLIDFNRCGVPLAEIVSEPDVRTAAQAAEYARALRETMRYLGIADCDMEKGGMRLEANISLQTQAQYEAGELPVYKVEVKNINSFNFMEQAVAFEIERQAEILEAGEIPVQETRGYNPGTGRTFSQRTKEDAADYRYFPDPDLPPIELSDEMLAGWRVELPPQKSELLAQWQKEWGIEPRFGAEFAENQKSVAWATELFAQAAAAKLKPNQLTNFIVNKKIEAQVGDEAAAIIKDFQALTATADFSDADLQKIIDQVLVDNQDAVAKYQAGQKQVIGFFVGQIMKAAGPQLQGAKLNPAQVNNLLVKSLK